jgi:endonuclease G
LEYHCEDLCKKENKELYVISGGVFHTDSTLMSKGVVPVPDSCFKIVVVLEKGQGLKDVNTSTQIIAVMIPNIDGVSKDDWEKYKTSIDKIESSTGYDFLNCVPKEIEGIIEK